MDVNGTARISADTHKALAELQAAENEHLGSIIEIQRAVAAADLAVDGVMRVICERTQELTNAQGATILILDGDDLVIRVATGFLSDKIGARVPIEGSQPGWMHLHDESGILGDARTDPRAGRLAHGMGVRSGVAVQLRNRDEKIGQLVVVSRVPDAFTQDDVDTLQRLSNVLSSALLHATEFETQAQQVESLGRFETIYRRAATGIAMISPEGRYLDVNPAFELMSGYTKEELAPMSGLDLVHPDDLARAEEALREIGAGTSDTAEMELRFFRKDGQLLWGHTTSALQRDSEGTPQFLVSMIEDITERKAAEEKLTYLAYSDAATGLANRAAFTEMLEASIANAHLLDRAVGVIDMDLDNFRLVNGSLGYAAGDELLIQVAGRLRSLTRETDLVARRGGNGFLLLVKDLANGPAELPGGETPLLVVEAVARRVHEFLKEPFTLDRVDFTITASLGIGLFPHDAADAKTLLSHAEVAMQRSKAIGPGGTVVFSSDQEDPMHLLQLTTQLRHAVEQESWVLHYQPIVDLNDGHVRGVEALIRGVAPNGDLIPPGEFIPMAEEIGLMGAIGEWVIGETCRQVREWNDAGLQLDVGFNVSPRQLLSARFSEELLQALETAGVDLHRMVIEITESAAMTDAGHTREILQSLHDAGLKIAIDDFGTGYSSLSRLRDLPIDILKIDRSFVSDAHLDPDAGTMVQAMVQLARNLGMQPLAEGVETTEELAFLRALRCPAGQGFLFSRPAPASEITKLLIRGASLIPSPAAA